MSACGCIGPQNGQPVCPCQMRNVKVINGRYVRVQDLGPAPDGGLPSHMLKSLAAQDRLVSATRVVDPIGRDLGAAD